ncbi:MAG: ABC transporter ATP-binding protein [Christensenellaceae bacterium]|nr:ABC transporter ATP-binding protein [Christensenellaceae bacterium]
MENINNNPVIISFKDVHKTYRLYKNDRMRFLGLFLKKRIPFKEFHAINGMSFEIRRGESVGFVGRNGAGKSTLLKLITGVAFPDSGEIQVNGQVAALLELTSGFDLEMTGRENIYLKGYILGLEKDQIKDIEEDVMQFADIGDFMDQPVRTYSSGMKARLGFAINVSVHPDILVIDEALSVGDAAFSAKCRAKVDELIESGVTVLFVSHAQNAVKEFCERAIFMERGKLKADGDAETVVDIYTAFLEELKKKKKK